MAIPPNDHAGLRFPEDIQPTLKLSHEDAVRILFRALELAKTTPFVWKYVDKPNDGTGILFFIQNHLPPPLDGIRYLQHEQRFAVPVNNQFELEVHEQGFGYIPGQEQIASRVRRRYRLTRGGHPNLFLYHWTRGPGQNVPQQLLLMPARNYPLPPHNDLPVFVHGDRRGQRVNMGAQGAPIPQPGHPQQVQLSAQNQHMAAHDARHRQAQVVQAAQRAPPPAPVPQPRLEEESDPADDLDHISTRTLASTRYKRNHELINQVFMHAAFGQRETTRRPPAYSSIFDKSKLEEKISSLTSELQDLRAKAAAREATRDEMKVHEDENMSFEAGPTEVSTNV